MSIIPMGMSIMRRGWDLVPPKFKLAMGVASALQIPFKLITEPNERGGGMRDLDAIRREAQEAANARLSRTRAIATAGAAMYAQGEQERARWVIKPFNDSAGVWAMLNRRI